jgi:transcriptional regulator with XRE-family HTH domain
MDMSRGKELRTKRLRLNWTQSTLLHFCKRMGLILGVSKISEWENGKQNIDERTWKILEYILSDKAHKNITQDKRPSAKTAAKQGALIKQKRIELGLSQDDLSEQLRKTGVCGSRTQISLWERGERRVPIETQEELKKILKM